MSTLTLAKLNESQIRVIKCISVDEINIHCSLEVVSLSTSTSPSPSLPYEAVSYVWGPKDQHATIWCDNMPVQVSANLAPALRCIWGSSQRRHVRLWCDVLSINQTDLEEKAAQVAMMDRIFKSASMVLIWLGSIDLSQAFELLEMLVARQDDDNDDKDTTMNLGVREAYNVARLACNEWFCRVWTFQEVRLAKSAVVLCEHGGEIEWFVFARALTLLTAKIHGPRADTVFARHVSFFVTRNAAENDDGKLLSQYYAETEANSAVNVSRVTGSKQLLRFLIFADSLQQLRTSTASNLTDLLLQNWYRAATDPRDKVYALLSDELLLVLDQTTKPTVDYTISVQTLFIQTARRCINQDQTLKILQIAGLQHSQKYPDTTGWSHRYLNTHNYLPSWVPDWTQFEMDNVPGAAEAAAAVADDEGRTHRGASLATGCDLTQRVDDSSWILQLKGCAMGVLNFDLQGNCWLQILPDNATTASQAVMILQSNSTNNDDDRNITERNRWPNHRPFPQTIATSQQYHASRHHPFPPMNRTPNLNRASSRLLLPSTSTYLPRAARTGDWLCRLDDNDGKTVFVLRPAYQDDPRSASLDGNGNKFALVGAAAIGTWDLVAGASGWEAVCFRRGWQFVLT